MILRDGPDGRALRLNKPFVPVRLPEASTSHPQGNP
jgi:hypothetical protein